MLLNPVERQWHRMSYITNLKIDYDYYLKYTTVLTGVAASVIAHNKKVVENELIYLTHGEALMNFTELIDELPQITSKYRVIEAYKRYLIKTYS